MSVFQSVIDVPYPRSWINTSIHNPGPPLVTKVSLMSSWLGNLSPSTYGEAFQCILDSNTLSDKMTANFWNKRVYLSLFGWLTYLYMCLVCDCYPCDHSPYGIHKKVLCSSTSDLPGKPSLSFDLRTTLRESSKTKSGGVFFPVQQKWLFPKRLRFRVAPSFAQETAKYVNLGIDFINSQKYLTN